MLNNLYYRNPESGLLEFQEEGFKPNKFLTWERGRNGGILSAKPKEFAADGALAILRIADPIATQLVQGFTNGNLIGNNLFKSVRMEKESGKFPAFGQEAFVIPGNIKRGYGERVQRLNTQTGSVQMSLSEYALGVSIENRERNEWGGSPDMLLTGKLNQVSDKIALYREYLQAKTLTTTTNYGTSLAVNGASQKWGNTATPGDPVKDMRSLILTVQGTIGRRPNAAWFTPGSWELFINNANVLNRIKYGGNPITPAQMTTRAAAELLQVDNVYVGYAVYGTGGDGGGGGVGKAALTTGYVWDNVGNQTSNYAGALVVGTGAGIEPAYGYTFERNNSPVVESWYDYTTKSQVWDYEHFFDAVVTLNTAGAMYYNLA